MKTLIAMLMVGMCWQASAQTKAKAYISTDDSLWALVQQPAPCKEKGVKVCAVYCLQLDGVTFSSNCAYVGKDHANPKPPAPAFHVESGILTACCPSKWKPHWINSQQAVCRSYPQTKAAHDKAMWFDAKAPPKGYVNVPIELWIVDELPKAQQHFDAIIGGGTGALQATELKGTTFIASSPVNDLTGCAIINSSGNTPNFQDISETYHCDQGDVTLHGKWGMTVEYGTIYRDDMGRQSDKTEPATKFDREFFQWCRKDSLQIVLCGNKKGPYHLNISLLPWYPNANDYPQVKGTK